MHSTSAHSTSAHSTSRTDREVADNAILGLDNVRLELPLAGLGSRGLAMSLDMMIVVVLMIVWAMMMMTFASFAAEGADWLFAIFGIGLFMIQWGYFSICEIFMDGQTPGKTIVGLRTISRLGGRPSVGAVLVRNFLRSIDMLCGALIIVLDGRRRRLGDMVAGTLVMHYREAQPGEEKRLGRVPESWSGREIAILESFLRRADRMETPIADEMASRLLDWAERRQPGILSANAPDAGDRPTQRLRRVFDWSPVPYLAPPESEPSVAGAQGASGAP